MRREPRPVLCLQSRDDLNRGDTDGETLVVGATTGQEPARRLFPCRSEAAAVAAGGNAD